jgi:hypothetical protein
MNAKVAAIIMALFVLSGLAIGNRNASVRASGGAYAELEDIRTNVSELAAKAQNYLTLANSMGLTGAEVDNLKDADNKALAAADKNPKSLGYTAAEQYIERITELDTAKDALNARIEKLGTHETERKSVFNAWSTIKNSVLDNTEEYNDKVAAYNKVWNGTIIRLFAAPAFRALPD